MNCCQIQGIEEIFDDQAADKELVRLRLKGPNKTTGMLINAIKEEAIQGFTILEIGGGVGSVHQALLEAGCQSAIDVDASSAYLHAAQEEAQRRGFTDRTSFQHGNFINLAEQTPEADIVVLDRVLCCYPDMENMVRLSAMRAKKVYGLVFPRDTWWAKIGFAIMNFGLSLQGSKFRIFPHSTQKVDAMVKNAGLKKRYYRQTLIWQVMVYSR